MNSSIHCQDRWLFACLGVNGPINLNREYWCDLGVVLYINPLLEEIVGWTIISPTVTHLQSDIYILVVVSVFGTV